MKPARILLILVAALFAAGVDGMGLRPLRSDFFAPKSRPTSQPSNPQQGTPDPSGSGSSGNAPSTLSGDISAAQIDQQTKSGEAVVVDARPALQYEEGHIPFAIHLPFEAFAGGKPAALEFYPPDQKFIIYCGGGDCDASEKVEIMLRAHGFEHASVYRPGWPGWLEYGGEIEKGAPGE